MLLVLKALLVVSFFVLTQSEDSKYGIYGNYTPDWGSLDARPLPSWYDEAKVGIFIHWGVYSVPAFHSEWFWKYLHDNLTDVANFMKQNYPPTFTYQDFGSQFTAELFDPDQWADLFQKSGARYVVLTSKHHEGYTLWPSSYSFGWNAKDVGPNRDLVGDLAVAVRKKNLTFGVYHSLFEWFNPLILDDEANKLTTTRFVTQKTLPELYELVNTYKPEIIWSDGDEGKPDWYWNSTIFLAWLYNESPVKDTVVVNDRWGNGTACKHGGFFNCADRYHPKVAQGHKWENALTINLHSWGYRATDGVSDYMGIADLVNQLVTTVSCGGNILINIGPNKDGMIDLIFSERLTQLGQWLDVNGEAIYKSQPWKKQNDTISGNIWYTQRPDLQNATYATFFKWPFSNIIQLEYFPELYNDDTKISLLGVNQQLSWISLNETKAVNITLPNKKDVTSDWAWTLKIGQ